MRHKLTVLSLAVLSLALGGCGASHKPIKFAVHSEPPGSYVVMQVVDREGGRSDWTYLGNTPLTLIREMDLQALRSAQAVSLKVMKEGYFDQTKEWGGKRFAEETKEKGRIYWNPRLVVTGQR
ncbi:MAG: hypothetical protein LJE84_13395 [Gammaproteobacteria bacterium]|nr:hypothetical protein [Gammaproteobacteria bacterium]